MSNTKEQGQIKYFIEDMETHLWYRNTISLEPTLHTFGKGWDKPFLQAKDYWTNDPQEALSFDKREDMQAILDGAFKRKDINFMVQGNWDQPKNLQVTEHEFITMETNKEQQHTPGPWSEKTHLDMNKNLDYLKPCHLLSKEDFLHACKCVNAMEGIEDPVDYLLDMHRDIRALQKYKTACESINPDNPWAVAENLREMYIILKEAEPMFYDAKLLHRKNGVHQEFLEEDIILIQRLKEVLTKIQEGK